MKLLFPAIVVIALTSTQAMAWGLGDIGGQLLKKGAESAVSGAVHGDNKQQTQQQREQAAAALNGQTAEPAAADGVVTGIASDAASQAASNAMANSGIPGSAVVGNVAGGLVKGFGGLFKKKPVPAAASGEPVTAAP